MGNITRREFVVGGLLAAGAAALSPLSRFTRPFDVQAEEPEPTATPEPGKRPNFIIVMTDDQDYSSWAEKFTLANRSGKPLIGEDGNPQQGYAMPFLRSFPEGGWTDFRQAAVVCSICGPSRASLLTGVPAATSIGHGVLRNGDVNKMDESNTLPVWLSEAGYETALRGKYNFGENERKRPTPPGWDYFVLGGRAGNVFRDGIAYIRDYAARGAEKPLCLFLTPVDPHEPAKPTGANARLDLIPPPAPPNFNEGDVSDKPSWIQRLKSAGRESKYLRKRKTCLQSILGVDDGIEEVFNALKETGLVDNTVIIFTSDNGYSFGNHRLTWKGTAYDESTRVPMVIRLPWLADNRSEDRAVSQADVTATIVELSGAVARRPLIGKSLKTMIEQPETYWEGVCYVEGHGGNVGTPGSKKPTYKGLRTGGDGFGRFTYVELPLTGERELYDLALDPWQMENVAGNPAYAVQEAWLSNRLQEFAAL